MYILIFDMGKVGVVTTRGSARPKPSAHPIFIFSFWFLAKCTGVK